MMKVLLLSTGIYLGLIFLLAYVLAKTAPRESIENETHDDEF